MDVPEVEKVLSCPDLATEINAQAIDRIYRLLPIRSRSVLDANLGLGSISFGGKNKELIFSVKPGDRKYLLEFKEDLLRAGVTVAPINSVVLDTLLIPDKRQPPEISLDCRNTKAMRRKEVEALRRENDRARALMQELTCGAWIGTQNGLTLDCNFTQRSFGIERQEMIGRSVYETLPELREISYKNLQEAFENPGETIEREFNQIVGGLSYRFKSKIRAYRHDQAICTVHPLEDL